MSRLLGGVSLAVVLALATAGCSGSDQSDSVNTPTTSTTATRTATTTTTAAPATTTTTAAVDDGIETDGDTVTADTIYVGLLADLSGPLSSNDVDLVDAQLVFWSDLNETGGIAGRQVELLIADTGSDLAAHQAAYERLKSRVVLFSHTAGSQNTAAIADDLVADTRLAVAAGSYSGWADPGIGANVIATGSSYCIEAMNGLNAIAIAHQEQTGALPILAIATDGSVYGEDSATGARILAEELGLEVRFDGGGTIDPVRDNSAIGGEIAGIGADWTWLATDPASAAEIVAAALTEGYAGAWSGAAPSFSPRLLATELGDYLAENWLHSALLSPMGAEVAGMPERLCGSRRCLPRPVSERRPGQGLPRVRGSQTDPRTRRRTGRPDPRGCAGGPHRSRRTGFCRHQPTDRVRRQSSTMRRREPRLSTDQTRTPSTNRVASPRPWPRARFPLTTLSPTSMHRRSRPNTASTAPAIPSSSRRTRASSSPSQRPRASVRSPCPRCQRRRPPAWRPERPSDRFPC